MLNKTLLSTQAAELSGINATIPKIVKYLADNRNCYLDNGVMRNIYQMKPLIPTAFNIIFDNILESDKLDVFAPIRTDMGTVPEFLSTNEFVLDLKWIPTSSEVLRSYPEFHHKVLINLSPILRVSKTTPIHYSVSDINVMHALFVRAALVASYQDSDGWLTPQLGVFIAKTYSMVISSLLAKQYDLTIVEQYTLASVFALYMCQMLGDKDDDLIMPALFNRCTFLFPQHNQLIAIAKAMEHYSKIGLNVGSICQLISELGPQRMKDFNPNILYRNISNLGTSTIQMALAFECPPLWVYQLLLTISGVKTRLHHVLKENRLFEDCKSFGRELNTSRTFIDILNTNR